MVYSSTARGKHNTERAKKNRRKIPRAEAQRRENPHPSQRTEDGPRKIKGARCIVPLPKVKRLSCEARQVLTGDWNQRRTRWNEELPVVVCMGVLSQPIRPGAYEVS